MPPGDDRGGDCRSAQHPGVGAPVEVGARRSGTTMRVGRTPYVTGSSPPPWTPVSRCETCSTRPSATRNPCQPCSPREPGTRPVSLGQVPGVDWYRSFLPVGNIRFGLSVSLPLSPASAPLKSHEGRLVLVGVLLPAIRWTTALAVKWLGGRRDGALPGTGRRARRHRRDGRPLARDWTPGPCRHRLRSCRVPGW